MTFDLRNLGDMAQASDTFVLFRYAGNDPTLPASPTFTGLYSPASIDVTGAALSVDSANNLVLLTGIVAVPEPAAGLALAVAAALAAARRRRDHGPA